MSQQVGDGNYKRRKFWSGEAQNLVDIKNLLDGCNNETEVSEERISKREEILPNLKQERRKIEDK